MARAVSGARKWRFADGRGELEQGERVALVPRVPSRTGRDRAPATHQRSGGRRVEPLQAELGIPGASKRRISPSRAANEEQKLGQFYGLEHVAIDTDNFAGEVAKIKADGIKILEERVLPDGRKVCFFEGPEGVRLEFLEMR